MELDMPVEKRYKIISYIVDFVCTIQRQWCLSGGELDTVGRHDEQNDTRKQLQIMQYGKKWFTRRL